MVDTSLQPLQDPLKKQQQQNYPPFLQVKHFFT